MSVAFAKVTKSLFGGTKRVNTSIDVFRYLTFFNTSMIIDFKGTHRIYKFLALIAVILLM